MKEFTHVLMPCVQHCEGMLGLTLSVFFASSQPDFSIKSHMFCSSVSFYIVITHYSLTYASLSFRRNYLQ